MTVPAAGLTAAALAAVAAEELGDLLLHGGFEQDARALARHRVEALRDEPGEVEAVAEAILWKGGRVTSVA